MRRLQHTPQSVRPGERARPNDSPWARVAFDTAVTPPVRLFGEQFSCKPRLGPSGATVETADTALPNPYQGGRSAAQRAQTRAARRRKDRFPRSPALIRTHNECAPLLQVGQAPVSEIATFAFASGPRASLLALLGGRRGGCPMRTPKNSTLPLPPSPFRSRTQIAVAARVSASLATCAPKSGNKRYTHCGTSGSNRAASTLVRLAVR